MEPRVGPCIVRRGVALLLGTPAEPPRPSEAIMAPPGSREADQGPLEKEEAASPRASASQPGPTHGSPSQRASWKWWAAMKKGPRRGGAHPLPTCALFLSPGLPGLLAHSPGAPGWMVGRDGGPRSSPPTLCCFPLWGPQGLFEDIFSLCDDFTLDADFFFLYF